MYSSNTLTLPLLSLLLFMQAAGQQAVNNSGPVQIHPGASMTLFGSFNNASSSGWVNQGTVYLRSNFSNHQPLMAAGSGTLVLNGTALQTLGGTQPFSINNLTTNNAAGIRLSNNLVINGAHSFVNGIITSAGATNFLVYNAGGSYSGESNSSHASGWVKKYGASDFSFPTGNGTVLRKIAISNLSALSEFNAHYGGSTFQVNNYQDPLVSINPNEYWELNRISGGTAQVTMNWNDALVDFPNYVVPDIKTVQFTGGSWMSAGGSASGNTAASGTITSPVLSAFGPMVLGSVSFVVPMHFLHVSAQRINDFTRVEWKTVDEENVQHYELQRASGNEFTTIALVDARNTRAEQVYVFPDTATLTGKIFYRVKTVDHDDHIKYSGIVSVQINNPQAITLINPVRNELQLLTGKMDPTTGRYRILNNGGQLVAEGFIKLGSAPSRIELPQLAAGTYFLSIRYGSEYFNTKFTKY